MPRSEPKFAGVELYFEDLTRAKKFYTEVLGLRVAEERRGHHARFDSTAGFICLEVKGAESYPSRDKAVLFFEVEDLQSLVRDLGRERFVQVEPTWAAMHDPEGHNVLLLQTASNG